MDPIEKFAMYGNGTGYPSLSHVSSSQSFQVNALQSPISASNLGQIPIGSSPYRGYRLGDSSHGMNFSMTQPNAGGMPLNGNHNNSDLPNQREKNIIEVDSPSKSNDKADGKGKKKGTGKKKSAPCKKWHASDDAFLIPFLVEQASKGLKCDKGFKKPAYVAAADAVNKKFNENFLYWHVENHFRSLRERWTIIYNCKNLSGAGWDDERKVIVLDDSVVKKYCQKHENWKQYFNRPILYYEELKIICGNDVATGSFKKVVYEPFGVPLEDSMDNEDDELVQDVQPEILNGGDKKQAEKATLTSFDQKSFRPINKRPRLIDAQAEIVDKLVGGLDNAAEKVANAILASRQGNWIEKLSVAVLGMDGFDLLDLNKAFEALCENQVKAQAFIVKPKILQEAWVKEFIEDLHGKRQEEEDLEE